MVLLRSAIQSEIATLLRSVSGVENVFEEEFSNKDYEQMLINFREDASPHYVQAWFIRRISSTTETMMSMPGRVDSCAVHIDHTFQVRLFYGYSQTKSETRFQALVDSVLDTFLTHLSLGAFSAERPLQLDDITDGMLEMMSGDWATFSITVKEHQRGLNFE